MNKQLIYKYLNKQASNEEVNALLDWVSQNAENEKFFTSQMNLWIAQSLPTAQANPADYAEFIQLTKKRKTSGKIVLNKKVLCGAAAILLCFFALNLTLFYKSRQPVEVSAIGNILVQNKKYPVIKELYTDKGVKAKLVLPDSSVVWLNSDTRISYPDEFGIYSREISFSGEAYFDVITDSLRPMIISNKKGFQVRVLGTTFNIKNYDNDTNAQVTLYSGRVEILRKNEVDKMVITAMLPNETVTISSNKPLSKIVQSNPQTASYWKEGKIIFSETKMSEVIKTLERWHGVSFMVVNPEILDYRFTARFNSESIVQIMEFLKMTTFTNYKIEGNNVILTKR